MTRDEIITTVLQFRDLARREMLTSFPKDSCIAATKITVEVMKYFGIDAKPLSAKVVVYNPVFVQLCVENKRLPFDEEELQRWQAAGGWSIELGSGRPKVLPDWNGHLVAKVDGDILVDLALDQADRPQKGIQLGPIAKIAPVDFLRGERELPLEINGCYIGYNVLPEQRGFRIAPYWRMPDRTRRTISNIIRQMTRNQRP